MGHDAAACCVLAHGAMPTLKDEPAAASDTFSCLTLPSFLEASSPSSEPSTSSSSTSELFTSVGLGNEASTPFDRSSGGDQTSALSTYHYKPSSSNLDCGGFSSALNIPPPILEEDLGISIDELDDVDHMSSENLNLEDTKPSANEMYLSDGGCWADSGCCDDVFMLRLDELLQSGNPQDFVVESGLTSMDDLFPDLSTAPEFSVLDDMSAWSGADTMQSLDSCLFPDAANVQAESSSGFGGEEESASQLFARWLQSNAHWISLSDLRKIKLKTSTIENATKRLGGGKKGLMLFLRFVLMWVQNSRDNLEVQKGTSPAPMLQSSNISPASCYLGTTAMSSVQGISRKDALCAPEAPDVLPGAKMHMHALSAHGSSPTPPLSADWTTPRAQGAIQTMIHPNANLSIHFPSSYTSITSGSACSPLPSTNCAQSNNPWLHQSANVVRGVHSQSMSSLPSVTRGSISRCTYGADVSSMMSSLQQPHCTDATPAATTRAARKSRMERQRWSVRHNRRWSGASLHHRLSASAASSGSAHTGLTSWSQNLRTGAQKSSYPSSHTCQQNSKGATAMEYQENKRPERNLKLLFHKELKQSDVGSLGRIVLPKAAEICLPPLELRDGVNLLVEDINSSKVWNMRYRFWPNNKSRMYLLENTSDFVKLYDLKEGDNMMMYVDVVSNRNVIRGVKGSRPAVASGSSNDVSNDGGHEAAAADEAACKRRRSLSKEEASLVSVGDSCDESLFVEFIEQSLDDLKDST